MKKINYWISGASGSWGNELIQQLLERENTGKIIGYSRGEFAQVQTTRKFNDDRLQMKIGDVRDYDRVKETMEDIDIVYHLAALKHLKVCQDIPNECIKTNVFGSQNVILSARQKDVKKCILISTDKSCEPNNIYGTSKYLAEQLFLQANKISNTKFTVIRAGNVLGSAGSVVPFFIKKAKNQEPLPITDYNMTRYMFLLPDAIKLVLRASDNIFGGETIVTKMTACNILTMAEVIMGFYNKDITWYKLTHSKLFPEIGIIPGEKIHESLINKHEALYTVSDENFRIILPMDGSLDSKYKDFPKSSKPYTSNDKLMNNKEIEEMLVKSGFLK